MIKREDLTDDEGDLFVVGDAFVSAADHLEQLVQLLLATAVLIHADVEDEALAT